MAVRHVLISFLTLALLLPVLYRRYQRRHGLAGAPVKRRGGRVVVMVSAAILLVGVMGGAALAANGDKNGSKTGTSVTNLIPTDKQGQQDSPTTGDVAAQTEKNRTAINLTWLMLGGIL